MAIYEERFATFTSWPHTRPDPETLAINGFQFVLFKESPDNVYCTECSTDFNGWRPRINPFAWHLKSSPTCPFIKRHERMLYNSSRRSGLEYALEQDQLRRIAPQRDQKWKDQLQQWEDEDREEELREKEEKEDQKPTPTPYSIGFFDPSLQHDFSELRLYYNIESFAKHTKECFDLYREVDLLQLLSKYLRGLAFTWY